MSISPFRNRSSINLVFSLSLNAFVSLLRACFWKCSLTILSSVWSYLSVVSTFLCLVFRWMILGFICLLKSLVIADGFMTYGLTCFLIPALADMLLVIFEIRRTCSPRRRSLFSPARGLSWINTWTPWSAITRRKVRGMNRQVSLKNCGRWPCGSWN